MFHRTVRLAAVFLFATIAAASAQTVQTAAVAPSALQRQADSALTGKDYARAVTLYRQIVASSPGDGNVWNRLGSAYYSTNEFAKAADAFQHAGHGGYLTRIVRRAPALRCDRASLAFASRPSPR